MRTIVFPTFRAATTSLALAIGSAAALVPAAAHAAGTWSAPTVLSANGSVSYPSLVAGPNGTATAIWLQTGGTNPGVVTSRRGSNGAWSAPQRMSDPAATVPDEEGFSPQLVAEPSGPVTAIWTERTSENYPGRIRTSRLVPSTGWSAAQTLAEEASGPSLAVDPNGSVFAAWTDSDGGRVRVRTTTGLWRDPRTIAESTTVSTYRDDEYRTDSNTVSSVKLAACGAQIHALWSSYYSYDWSSGDAGGGGTGNNWLYSKDLPLSGAWPAVSAGVQETLLVAGAAVTDPLCSPSRELTIASIGDYEAHNPFGFFWYRFAGVTKAASGTWGELEPYEEKSGESGPGLDITAFRFAYGTDGALLRAVEKNKQVTVAAKPRGGAWSAAAPLLPTTSPTTSPAFYVSPSGEQSLFVGREGDVPARAEVRQRTSTTGAWGAPVTISTPGALIGGVQAAGNADGTVTALTLERSGPSTWRLTSSTQTPTPPAPTRVPVKLSGTTLTFDADLSRTAAACPAASAIWVTPTNTVNGVKTNVPVSKRTLAIKVGPGNTCTITGTATLGRTPSRTGLTVSIGATGLTSRTFLPA